MRGLALLASGLVWFLSSGAVASDDTDDEACLVHERASKGSGATPDVTWWLLRQGNRVETRSADGQLGELWTRSASGQTRYFRLDHVERVAIEYASGDLSMMGVEAADLWIWESPLPVELPTRSFERPVQLRLECEPLGDSNVAMSRPEFLDAYRLVDFIDLGDMEGDVQLQRVIRRQGK
jgi:hypothetical protein